MKKAIRGVVAVVAVIASAVAMTARAESETRSFWRFNPQKEKEPAAKPATPIQAEEGVSTRRFLEEYLERTTADIKEQEKRVQEAQNLLKELRRRASRLRAELEGLGRVTTEEVFRKEDKMRDATKVVQRQPWLVQQGAVSSAVKYQKMVPTGSVKRKKRPGAAKKIPSKDDEVYCDSNGKPYPEADQKIMAAAVAAIENDDLEGARSLAEAALKSDNADLKEKVVEALGWFGEEAMAELTPFMSDANEEVAKAATDNWVDAFQNMDDDGVKAGVVEMALKSIRNKDILEDVANELIGLDELAALQVIANVIEGGNNAAAEAARETYETITGEKWSGVGAAEKWLQQNYKPPEDDK